MRFILQQSNDRAGWWVCTDTENGLVCIFEHQRFNETQEFTFLDDFIINPAAIAGTAREMGDWLIRNHYNKIMK